MLKSEKKVKELSVLLSEENSSLISEAIGLLRDEEPFEGAISLLASFYDKSEDNPVRKTIEGFMNDLKDQSVSREDYNGNQKTIQTVYNQHACMHHAGNRDLTIPSIQPIWLKFFSDQIM